MKNIKITVGTCAYLSHAFKYVCSQYGVTSCQGEHKMKIRSLSVLVAMILLIGCYSPVAKVDAAEKNYKKEYQKIVKESYIPEKILQRKTRYCDRKLELWYGRCNCL